MGALGASLGPALEFLKNIKPCDDEMGSERHTGKLLHINASISCGSTVILNGSFCIFSPFSLLPFFSLVLKGTASPTIHKALCSCVVNEAVRVVLQVRF